MVARLAVLPRVAIVGAACVLATLTATVTFAASGGSEPPAATPPAEPAPAPTFLVVPDVRQQAYVFAKGSLEEAGFAWRVAGSVHGYAANTVVAQAPAAGTRVIDNGSPTITLTLARNGKYAQDGDPEDASPFTGTPVQLPAAAAAPKAPAEAEEPAADPATPAAPAAPAPAHKPKPAAKRDARTPAFLVPGAPKEPLDEMTLDKRARALEAWVTKHPAPSTANVNRWLYQHAWIVTGARFGWSHGEEALRILVRVDRKVEARWGVGSKSRSLVERTLAQVQASTG